MTGPTHGGATRIPHKSGGGKQRFVVPQYPLPVSWADGLPIACRDEDPELFFPPGFTGPAQAQIEEAKAVCGRCPFTEECLAVALANNEEGVWGGTTELERRAMRKRRAS